MNDVRTVLLSAAIVEELELISAEYALFNNCNFNLVNRYPLSVNLTLLQCNGYQML
jgi:hypothetical protein